MGQPHGEGGDPPQPEHRVVRFEHSLNLVPLLTEVRASLLVSTYQAGKLAVAGVDAGTLSLAFHNFERAMGVAVSPLGDRIAVGTQNQVWTLRAAPDLAPCIQPVSRYDACYLARSSLFTGEIQGHEMAFTGDDLWMVNTLFSCLCTVGDRFSFIPRWRPPFITGLAAEDRCHLNGLAMVDGSPKYVTAMAETDEARGWRPVKGTAGCLIDVPSGETVARGFAMPHSPRVYGGRVWALDSGRGRLITVDPSTGKSDLVTALPGYTRGLAFAGPFAFVGLSKIRETSTFGGISIAEHRETLRCGVAVVDLRSGQAVSRLEFLSGVEEIFDVQVLPQTRLPFLSGPHPAEDGGEAVWVVPEPR